MEKAGDLVEIVLDPQYTSLFTRRNYYQLTVCVTRKWAGVDSAWEQEKPEARKMPVNRADSHLSGARFVRR